MSFYLFIAISFYLNIVCKNIVCELGLNMIKNWKKVADFFLQNYLTNVRKFQSNSIQSQSCMNLRLKWWKKLLFRVSIPSTFYLQIFCTKVILAAFSSYVLALLKNSYKKRAHITLMKLTTGLKLPLK